MDMTDIDFDGLALRYGQLGTLCWERGQPVRLRMYAEQPLTAKPRDFVQWMGRVAPAKGPSASHSPSKSGAPTR
jgi:hypothetical protein